MPAQTTNLTHMLKCAGPQAKLCYVKFTGVNGAAPTVDEAHGVSATVSRSGEGVWVVTLKGAVKAMAVVGLRQVSGNSAYHELTHTESVSAKTVTITHKTCAYADIATGPAADDMAGQITLTVLVREAS
jgi:hypothetical protein